MDNKALVILAAITLFGALVIGVVANREMTDPVKMGGGLSQLSHAHQARKTDADSSN